MVAANLTVPSDTRSRSLLKSNLKVCWLILEGKRSVRITTARSSLLPKGQIGISENQLVIHSEQVPRKQIAGSVWLSWQSADSQRTDRCSPIWSTACEEALRKSPDRKFCGSSGWHGRAWKTLTWSQPSTINPDKHYDLTWQWHNFFKLSFGYTRVNTIKYSAALWQVYWMFATLLLKPFQRKSSQILCWGGWYLLERSWMRWHEVQMTNILI